MFKFKNRQKITKDNLYQKLKEKNAETDDVIVVLGNAIYDELLSESTKKVLGIKTLYPSVERNQCKVTKSAAMNEKIDAMNEVRSVVMRTSSVCSKLEDVCYKSRDEFWDKAHNMKGTSDFTKVLDEGVAPDVPQIDEIIEMIKNEPFDKPPFSEYKCKSEDYDIYFDTLNISLGMFAAIFAFSMRFHC